MVGVRGFLYRLAMACAVGAVTIGAVDKSVLNDQFNIVQVDGLADLRVDAYIKLVQKTKDINGRRFIAAKNIRAVAEDWIQGYNMGKLKPILPGYFGENMTEGPKGEIIFTCTRLARRMSDLAIKEYESGQYAQSCEDSVRAMDLFNMVRFTSPSVYDVTLAFYRRPLQTLNMALAKKPKLAPHVFARLTKSGVLETRFREMKEHDRNIRTQYAVRYGERMLKEDENVNQFYSPKVQLAASPFAEIPGEKQARTQAKACGFANIE